MRAKRLLVIGTGSSYGREVMRGIHSYCRMRGNWEYHLELNAQALDRVRIAIRDWKPDGIIARVVIGGSQQMLQKSGVPVVNFNTVHVFNFPTVIPDYLAVGRLAAQHFLVNGMRHFGFASRTFELFAQQSCKGFVGELAAAGHECEVFDDQCPGAQGETQWVENRKRMREWLRLLKKPVAIMCIYDIRAQEVCVACQQLGLRVPDDVAIVGVGNEEDICHLCTPPLSSVDTGTQRIGHEAARLLERMLRGGKAPVKPVLVSPLRVITRQSSDIIGVEDEEVATAMRFIRDHAQESISVRDVVAQMPVCRRTLEARFEKFIGRTPKAEITRVRMSKAQSLLGTTDLPVKVVAGRMHFDSARRFSIFFRRKTGLTPTQYRRHLQGGNSKGMD